MNSHAAFRSGIAVLLFSSLSLFSGSVQAGIVSYMVIECNDSGCYQLNAPVNVNPPGGCQFPPCYWT